MALTLTGSGGVFTRQYISIRCQFFLFWFALVVAGMNLRLSNRGCRGGIEV